MAFGALDELFADGLLHLYGAHGQGARQADANRDSASAPELRRFLQAGAKANRQQAQRLERVARLAGTTLYPKHDPAMQGIVDANKSMLAAHQPGLARDLVNIAAGQVAAHFYLATYGTLRAYALRLGHDEAAALLEQTLDETGQVDRRLSRLASRLVRKAGGDAGRSRDGLLRMAASHPWATPAVLLGMAGLAALMSATARNR